MAEMTDVVHVVYVYDTLVNMFVVETVINNPDKAIKIAKRHKFSYVIKDGLYDEVIFKKNCKLHPVGLNKYAQPCWYNPELDFTNIRFSFLYKLFHKLF